MRSPAWPMLMVALAGAALAGAGCTAYPAAPAQPAYDLDVLPIFMAHCVRCHGAGDMLNTPTEPTGPHAPPIPSVADAGVQFAAVNLYLNQFNDTADKNGAAGFATTIALTLSQSALPPILMPPAPAPRLDDWSNGTVINWTKNPICSNSLNPDPAICPNGPGKP